jgi:hypothetical protein
MKFWQQNGIFNKNLQLSHPQASHTVLEPEAVSRTLLLETGLETAELLCLMKREELGHSKRKSWRTRKHSALRNRSMQGENTHGSIVKKRF